MSEVDEQIRALTELVKQLQAENSQLRDWENVPVPELASQAASTGCSGQTTSGCNGVAYTPAPERVSIHAPQTRKCPRFSGIMAQDHMTVEEWVEEARKSLSMQQTSLSEQATFLYDLLDGEAQREIKFISPSDRAHPETIFTILLDNFGCDQTYVTLQKRQQRGNETIREFSHALLELLGQLKNKDPRGVPNPDMVIRDTFIENVCDGK